jgi:uncharacterized protein
MHEAYDRSFLCTIDASTIVGAALRRDGVPRQAILGSRALSSEVEAETRGVLARRKFARALTDEDRTIILALITDAAVWVEPALKVNDCRDQKDNKYPELAATAGAEVFISSDDDRLVLDPWHGIRIVRSVEFLGMAQPSARDPGRSLPA